MIKPYFYYCIWKSHTIFRHDNHLLMAKYGLGCQAHAFQSILEWGRCSACSMAFCLSGELWNTSPTYRCEYRATPMLSLSETTSSMEAVVCTWELVALVPSLLEACPGFFFSFSLRFFLLQLGLMCPFF